MPASSDSPYKSRLFNFLNRQSIRLSDRLGTTIRHLKTATETGLQLFLYSAYMTIQSGRSFRRQLEQKVKPSSLYLPFADEYQSQVELLSTDESIEEVLTKVQDWLTDNEFKSDIQADQLFSLPTLTASNIEDPWLFTSEKLELQNNKVIKVDRTIPKHKDGEKNLSGIDKFFSKISNSKKSSTVSSSLSKINYDNAITTSSESSSSLTIQGIATQLETRNLVLVTNKNKLFVLNSKQEELLNQYFYQKKITFSQRSNIFLATTQKLLANLPEINNYKYKLLPPVSFLEQLLERIKNNEISNKQRLVATKNSLPLLKESKQILPSSAFPNKRIMAQSLFIPKLLLSIDRTIANLETQPINITSVINLLNKSSLIKLRQAQNIHSLEKVSNSPSITETDPFQIQVLISAAIEYFFSKHQTSSLRHSSSKHSLNSSSNSPILPSAKQKEPWLSWNDLFSHISVPQIPPLESSSIVPANNPEFPILELPSIASLNNNSPYKKSSIATVNKRKKSTSGKLKTNRQKENLLSTQLTYLQAEESSINQTSQEQNSEITESFDWIETNATPVGYIKHPLEKILELLDRIMLILEELAGQVWQKIKQLNIKN
jgi:hypothetical protein